MQRFLNLVNEQEYIGKKNPIFMCIFRVVAEPLCITVCSGKTYIWSCSKEIFPEYVEIQKIYFIYRLQILTEINVPLNKL